MCVCVGVGVGVGVCVCTCSWKFVLTVFCSSLCDGSCAQFGYSTLKSTLLLPCQLNMVYMGEAQWRCVYHHTTLKDLTFKVAGGGGPGGIPTLRLAPWIVGQLDVQ